MATARRQLGQADFDSVGAGVTVYTVPGSTIAVIKSLDIANLQNTPTGVFIHLVPNGGSAGIDNALMYGLQVPAFGMASWTGAQILDTPGDFIYARCGADGHFCVSVSGVEET